MGVLKIEYLKSLKPYKYFEFMNRFLGGNNPYVNNMGYSHLEIIGLSPRETPTPYECPK